MEISLQKDKIAIIVVCYNRPDSTKRLLESLSVAHYPDHEIPLVISVDCSGNETLYRLVQDFEWTFGPKYVVIHSERLGLKKHIYTCGDLTEYFKGVIILEDDLFVAPDFYRYSEAAVQKYYDESKVAGIALYADTMYGYVGLPLYAMHDGSDGYMMQSVITSGECFTDRMWQSFRQWYANNEEIDPTPFEMPEQIKRYRRAWSKYFNMYLLEKNCFFLHPHLSTTTNCGEAGEHGGRNNMIHSCMLYGTKEYCFRDFDQCVKYDIFGNFIGLGQMLSVAEEDLCVDLYGDKMNAEGRRYWLSPFRLPYRKIKSFGLVLEPMEANILYGIAGDDLHLYDTSERVKGKACLKFSRNYLSYHIRNFHYQLLMRYLNLIIREMAFRKMKNILHIV